MYIKEEIEKVRLNTGREERENIRENRDDIEERRLKREKGED